MVKVNLNNQINNNNKTTKCRTEFKCNQCKRNKTTKCRTEFKWNQCKRNKTFNKVI